MFDKNYLNHGFESTLKYNGSNDYFCQKCKIIIWYDGQYRILQKKETVDDWREKLKLTCDEMIIKNIIE